MIAAFVNFTGLTVMALICAMAAVALAYRRIYFALMAANFALIFAFIDKDLELGTYVFWLVASGVAGLIVYMLPERVNEMRKGVSFFVTGALAGMAVGVAIGTTAALILGAAVGVLFGAIIFNNVIPNPEYKFPSKQFVNYILAKGLPIVVVMSMVGLVLARSIAKMSVYV